MSSLSWNEFRKKISKDAEAKGIAISGVFELTARCNLQCKMCYVKRAAGDRTAFSLEHSAEQWIRLAREACDAGMLYVLFTGGEVLLRNDFREIYTEVKKIGMVPSIYSNATLITREVARWIGQSPPEEFEVTLYGASEESYFKVCGQSGSFKKAVKGIDLLLNAGVKVSVKTTVIPENVADYEGLMTFAKERDLPLYFCVYISPRRDEAGQGMSLSRLMPEQLAKYLHRANEDFCRLHKKAGRNVEGKDSGLLPTALREDRSKNAFKCSAGSRDCWITWDGRMVPCGLMDEPFCLPFETGFLPAWKKLRRFVSEVPECGKCKNCSFRENCLSCPARLKNETGFFDRPANYLCELVKWQGLMYNND